MRVVPENARHVSVGGLATSAWLLGLFGWCNDPGTKHLVLVGGGDAELVQFLLHYFDIGNFDLIPDLLELVVKVFN